MHDDHSARAPAAAPHAAPDEATPLAPPTAQQLLRLADASPHLVWIAGPEGAIRFVNQAAVDYFRVPASTMLGDQWLRLLHPDDVVPTRERWLAALASGGPFATEYRILRGSDQSYRVHLASASRAPIEDGEAVWYGTCTDIHDSVLARDELARLANRLSSTLESLTDAFLVLDGEARITYANRQAETLFGRARAALQAQPAAEVFAAAGCDALLAPALAALAQRHPTEREADAGGQWFNMRAFPSDEGVAIYLRDVSAARASEQRLHLKREALMACASPIAIIGAREHGYPVSFVNPAAERVLGHSAAEIMGQSLSLLWDSEPEQPGVAELRAACEQERQGRAVVQLRRADGELLWFDATVSPVPGPRGDAEHFVVAMYDITGARRYEAELAYQTSYDALTGLANRSLLLDRARQLVARAAAGHDAVWVVYLDVDRFKAVNDAFGHGTGDEVLRALASRIAALLGPADTAARVAADEFALLIASCAGETAITALAQRIREAIAEPLTIAGQEHVLSCSTGIAAWSSDCFDAETLLRHANLAMLRAKQTGRGFQFYVDAMNEHAAGRLQLEGQLRHALERNELTVHYQPQVDLASGRVVGMEALLRWKHPLYGMVPPGGFIPLAEETGLIHPIGAWVLRTACLQNKVWQDAGLPPLRIAVNLSGKQFYQPDLIPTVEAVLRDTGLDARWLELELTEGLVAKDVEHAVSILSALKRLGVKLSIDDFGTGYSSLSYLKSFPIDLLKVDQSFVRNIATDPADAAIARTIIALGHNLGLHVIAEGVETEEQLTALRAHGCDQVQGYYFSRPVPAAELERLLRDGNGMLAGAAGAPEQTLLIVERDGQTTDALRQTLDSLGYRILVAHAAQEAYSLLARHQVQVILCGQHLAGATGTAFLMAVRDLYPDTMRLMLADGETGAEAIIEAINGGAVFRFHTRPWNDDALRTSIGEAFRYHWSGRNAAECGQCIATRIGAAAQHRITAV
jgi:diguanylate cyclase (GGDEF)-like protein/PAS domain S-box-containing protein